MRQNQALLNDTPNLPGERRGSPKRTVQSVEPLLDVEERHWPLVSLPQRVDVSRLEETIARQSEELNLRCTQVADLYNLQQRQANDLQVACEEIDRLNSTISTLLDTTARQETEAAATKQQLIILENEKAALQAQLDRANQEANEVSRRLLAIETSFNNRETILSSALEQIESLNAELILTSAERFKVVAATTGEKQRYRSELNQQKSSFESRIKNLETEVADQVTQIKGLEVERSRLARRIDILETLRKSEREALEFKIRELTEELQHERLGHSAEHRAFAALHQKTASLLPKLATQNIQPNLTELGTLMPHNSAA
jgi:chromosome segregation ATPase